jgi:outer membrane protein TolC
VRSAGRRIDTAFRSIAAAASRVSWRAQRRQKKKFENGMTTSFQVSQIQNDLTTARSNELLAIAAYRKAINAWHNTVGDILSYKKVTLEGLPVTLDPTPAEEGAVR